MCGRAICTGMRERLLVLEETGVRERWGCHCRRFVFISGGDSRLLASRVELLMLFAVKERNTVREGYGTSDYHS